MRREDTKEEAAFRVEVRAWLEANAERRTAAFGSNAALAQPATQRSRKIIQPARSRGWQPQDLARGRG